MRKIKVIYRITYPNGKIYIGSDAAYSLVYFGSPDAARIAADFSWEEQRDFSIRKEILWESDSVTDSEVRTREMAVIRQLGANNPAIGYNQIPKFRAP